MADDDRTRLWRPHSRPKSVGDDPALALGEPIAEVRAAPWDQEARRRLRAVAAESGAWDALAGLLAAEVEAAADAAIATAMLEELADIHESAERSAEAIAALEHLVDLVPDDALVHDRLARLYHAAGAWADAARAFERVGALARDDRGRAALRAAARLHRDHGEPMRAAAIYRAIVGRRPTDREAWRALDEILAEQCRWRELAEVRGELAARTADPVDRAALLRGQARALERAGDAVGAATLLTESAGLAPDEVSGVIDYAEILAAGGRAPDAAALLTTRIAAAVAAGAPALDVAALRIRLAAALEDCGRDGAADAVLAELCAACPGYPPALERLAARAARRGDARAHADALVAYAQVIPEPAARAAVLVEAGRRLREAGARDDAAQLLTAAAALAPDDPAVRTEREAALAAVAVARARDRGRAGDAAGAEAELRGVLATAPADVEAALALAELLADRGRHPEAAEHLRATLADADAAPPDHRARLVHRYALAMAACGDADAAHQLLHEAHRLDRKDLAVTLALGDSCFARRLYREAAIHLGSLAAHRDAPDHPALVAHGLVRAAQACVRGLRPADAEGHYAAAVRLDPACAPAWHGLAEIATERGDLEGAAVYLEREGESAPAGDRLRLFAALGELALDVLHDAARAERCWQRVADVAPREVLERLLALQRRRAADAARGATCRRLAALAADPAAARDLLVEAADAYAADGDLGAARACADELIAGWPNELDALACASAISVATGDHAATAEWLTRALASESPADDGDPRRAELWRRLADARRARGDLRGARAAYTRAIETAAESDGAHAARRALVELGGPADEATARNLAELVAAEQDPRDVLRWAHRCAAAGDPGARPLFDLARALGARLDSTDEAIAARVAPRVMASDESYAAALDPDARAALIDDPAEAALAPILAALAEAAALVWPPPRDALAQAGHADAERISSANRTAVASMLPAITRALGGPTLVAFAARGADAPEVTLLAAAPPVVVLGRALAAPRARSRHDADLAEDTALRFRLGRIVELARDHRIAAAGAGLAGFERFVAVLWHAFARPTPAPPSDAELGRAAERLRAVVPLLLRRRLGDLLAVAGRPALDATGYHAACARAADRAGMLACGDVGVAVALAGGPDAARHLIELATRPAFHAARARLWAPRRR